jgi:two-component sensor histidine kinase
MRAVHPEDLAKFHDQYLEAFKRRETFQAVFRLRHRSGEYRWVVEIGKPFNDMDGRFAGYIGTCLDITEQITAEDRIRASLEEKEVLLKEIHHRVKNNLQVISSLLSLQAGSSQDPETLRLLRESHTRVKSIALIHEKLYQSPNLTQVDIQHYIRSLTEYLCTSYGLDPEKIRLRLDLEQAYLGIGTAIPCGLIINELVSNALKHAFPGDREGEIYVGLHRKGDGEYALVVKDNGIGLPEDLDFPHANTLGMELVGSLVEQLDGRACWSTCSGTNVCISFPVPPNSPC